MNYGILDLFSDIGGVTEMLIFIFGFLMYPLSRQSFLMKSMKLLYSLRTTDDILLEKVDNG